MNFWKGSMNRVGLKSVNMQIALPWLQDAGQVQEQSNKINLKKEMLHQVREEEIAKHKRDGIEDNFILEHRLDFNG